MSGHEPQDQRATGFGDMVRGTKDQLARERLGWEIAEAESQRGHEHNNHSRRATIINATNEGKFDLPRISVEQAHRLSRLTVPIILATVVLLGACWGMGVFRWLGEAVKPDPTPMIVLMPDSQNPGAYVTALYMPPTTTPEPTQVPTQVDLPVDVVPSAVPTFIPASPVPLTAETKVYIVMKFTISPEGNVILVDGRFNEGSLEGYQKIGDTQSCTLSNMPTFSVPAGYSEGLVYFEGIDKYQRPSGATVVGSTISFNLCTPVGTNFSLHMK